jgi:anti-sigma factor RsiW
MATRLEGRTVNSLSAVMRDRLECMRVKPLLHSYLDGHLTDEDAVRVSRHLDACRRCGIASETFLQIKAGLARLGEEPDREAVQRLEQFVEEIDADQQ